jgi:S1-C subfamily serine protease
MPAQLVARVTAALLLWFVFAPTSQAAEAKLGFSVKVEGEGFFLNPVITKIIVDEVTKGSIAEVAGIKVGDIILRINGRAVAGRRALELRSLMKMDPGETRTFRLKHPDGTEVEARITKPTG